MWSSGRRPLCGSIDAAQQVVLGFLKYISDAFEERQVALLAEWAVPPSTGRASAGWSTSSATSRSQRARPLARRARPRLRGTSRIAVRERRAARARSSTRYAACQSAGRDNRAVPEPVYVPCCGSSGMSCSRSRSSGPMPPRTGTAARRKPTPPDATSCGRQEPWRSRSSTRRASSSGSRSGSATRRSTCTPPRSTTP